MIFFLVFFGDVFVFFWGGLLVFMFFGDFLCVFGWIFGIKQPSPRCAYW